MFDKMSMTKENSLLMSVSYDGYEFSFDDLEYTKVDHSAQFIEEHNILNIGPRLHESLCGKYKRSFAYLCLYVHLPKIIREMKSTLQQSKECLIKRYGDYVHYDMRRISWSLDLLLTDILQNAPFKLFFDQEPDTKSWNDFLLSLGEDKCQWYTAVWHQAECYLFRRMYTIFKRTDTLSKYDYFETQKKFATRIVCFVMAANLKGTRRLRRKFQDFRLLLKLTLWSHRCDLSITQIKPLMRMKVRNLALNKDVIVDESEAVWHLLDSAPAPVIVDIVCNNTGYELFTDLLLAEYLIEKGLARKVRFHVKAIPWLILNATTFDFRWMLHFFISQKTLKLAQFGQKLSGFLKDGSLQLCDKNYFWTSGHSFHKMREIAPCLYVKLSEADLVIFKGDNNYRKLLADICRNPTEPFINCIMPFLPTNVCALRPVFSDLYCGMPICAFEWLTEEKLHWMKNGEKATIQLAVKPRP